MEFLTKVSLALVIGLILIGAFYFFNERRRYQAFQKGQVSPGPPSSPNA